MKTTVYEDEWHGASSRDIEYTTTEPLRVAQSLQKLDGRIKTIVSLERGENVLSIGGGNDGRYMAYFAHNIDEELFNLVNTSLKVDGGEVEIVTGGQAGLFSPRACLDIETVSKAAAYFVSTGGRDPGLVWDPA